MSTIAARFRFLTPVLVALLACPVAAPAAPPAKVEKATDVALSSNGLLTGQVVDAKGKPFASATVLLHGSNGKAVPATTNARGQFAYRGVGSGVYYLQSGESIRLARVWNERLAPPKAQNGVLLVAESDTVRGQYAAPNGVNSAAQRIKWALTNPIALGTLVATAVAVPVAIHNSDDGS